MHLKAKVPTYLLHPHLQASCFWRENQPIRSLVSATPPRTSKHTYIFHGITSFYFCGKGLKNTILVFKQQKEELQSSVLSYWGNSRQIQAKHSRNVTFVDFVLNKTRIRRIYVTIIFSRKETISKLKERLLS